KEGKPFLQGWAVVDNPTDDDWNNVGMALISGRPISFQMDLYQPLYVPRPTVELELFQSLRPVAYDGGKREVMDMPMAAAPPPPMAPPGPGGGGGFGGGRPMGGGMPGGPGMADAAYRKDAAAFGARLSESMNKRMELGRGVQSAATASQLGDFFQYV